MEDDDHLNNSYWNDVRDHATAFEYADYVRYCETHPPERTNATDAEYEKVVSAMTSFSPSVPSFSMVLIRMHDSTYDIKFARFSGVVWSWHVTSFTFGVGIEFDIDRIVRDVQRRCLYHIVTGEHTTADRYVVRFAYNHPCLGVLELVRAFPEDGDRAVAARVYAFMTQSNRA